MMNTVFNSREEALDRGKLINLDDEGWTQACRWIWPLLFRPTSTVLKTGMTAPSGTC